MTENNNLYADLSDNQAPKKILKLAKDLDRLVHRLEKHPCLDLGAVYRISCLRYDINSAVVKILAIYHVETNA